MNKNFVIIALLIALISVTIYSFPLRTTEETAKKLSFNSEVCVYTRTSPTSSWIQDGECTHNTMWNTGLNWTRDLIGNAVGAGAMNVIALGNFTSAQTATLTVLNNTATNVPIPDCGLNMTAGSYSKVDSSIGNWSISKVFTSTCNNELVNTTALLNATSSGTYFAGKDFSASVTLQNNDQLNVTWYIWVS